MTYSKLRKFLEQFLPLTDDDFTLLKGRLFQRQLRKKDFLIREGETERNIYFLIDGLAHQYFFKGKEMITTDFMCEGGMTGGIVSFFSDKPSYYNVQALEPTTVIGISRENLDELYALDRKWQRMGRLLVTYYLLRQENEIIDTIRLTMRERFLQFATQHPDLLERVPQRRIASYLNIKAETFSRLKPLLHND